MSLFMDVHTIDGGVSVEDVAQAHEKDLETQRRVRRQLPALLGG